MSQVKWGSFEFEPNEANVVRWERAATISPRGFKIIDVWRVVLEVVVEKDTVANLTTRLNQIRTAFASNYSDLTLYTDDAGSIPSAHYLTNSNSLSGVRVIRGPAFDRADGAEYANKRTTTITLEATYDVSDSDLVMWEDSIRFLGTGGQDYAVLPTFDGPAYFPLGTTTPQTIVRTGRAVGFVTWVSPPGLPLGLSGTYLVPALLQQEELGNAQCLGNAYRFFPSSWNYTVICFTPQIIFPSSR